MSGYDFGGLHKTATGLFYGGAWGGMIGCGVLGAMQEDRIHQKLKKPTEVYSPSRKVLWRGARLPLVAGALFVMAQKVRISL